MISPIKNVFLNINNTCPYQCDYCWVRKTKGEQLAEIKKKMTFEILQASYAFCKKLQQKTFTQYPDNILCIIFATKEPLLEFNNLIRPFIEQLNNDNQKYHIVFQILTNGLLLSTDIVEFCKKHNIKILMSLDGNEESNNMNRKYYKNGINKAFEYTLQGASLLDTQDRCFTFTINKNTIPYLYDSLCFLSSYPHNWTRFNFNLYSHFSSEDWKEIWNIFQTFFNTHTIKELSFLKLYKTPSTAIDENRDIILGIDYQGNISIKKPFHSSIPWTDKNNMQYKEQGLIRSCGNVVNNIQWEHLEKWIMKHGPSYSHTNFYTQNKNDCKQCFCYRICHPYTNYFSYIQQYELLPEECKIRQTDFKITEYWREKYEYI